MVIEKIKLTKCFYQNSVSQKANEMQSDIVKNEF